MSTETLIRPQVGDPALSQGEGRRTHIIKPKGERFGQDVLMEALIEGTPVEALCGYIWVPSHDPKKYPRCEKCNELYDAKFGDGRSGGVS